MIRIVKGLQQAFYRYVIKDIISSCKGTSVSLHVTLSLDYTANNSPRREARYRPRRVLRLPFPCKCFCPGPKVCNSLTVLSAHTIHRSCIIKIHVKEYHILSSFTQKTIFYLVVFMLVRWPSTTVYNQGSGHIVLVLVPRSLCARFSCMRLLLNVWLDTLGIRPHHIFQYLITMTQGNISKQCILTMNLTLYFLSLFLFNFIYSESFDNSLSSTNN